jgi:(p)ppGpp synthase/HD superfamily hydrolase
MQNQNNKAQLFALDAHKDQMYGEYPYMVHLGFVNHYVNKYKHLISSEEDFDIAISAGWLHDTLEDCQIASYQILESEFGEQVANTVKALTNIDGKYNLSELKNNKIAYFVKLCDRLANVSFLKINFKEKAYFKYEKQFEEIEENCPEEYVEMVRELDLLLGGFREKRRN